MGLLFQNWVIFGETELGYIESSPFNRNRFMLLRLLDLSFKLM